MASCSPVAPVMDWTEDVELHKRDMEWKEEVELEIGSTLSGKSNSVKSNYVLRWAGKPARDYLKSLPDSEFKYEGANADEILTALAMRTRPKSNEIAAVTKLCSLKQGDMPLSEFIWEARRLAELCNYPNDKDRLIRDVSVRNQESKSLPKVPRYQRLECPRLHNYMPSRGCHSHASTRLQARVYQHNAECADYDSS